MFIIYRNVIAKKKKRDETIDKKITAENGSGANIEGSNVERTRHRFSLKDIDDRYSYTAVTFPC